AGPGTVALYIALVASVLLRLAAGLWPDAAPLLYAASGLAWIAAFGGFALLYGPALLRAPAAKAG
ncbi:NnrS family protein, partial [Roseovarius tolerans]